MAKARQDDRARKDAEQHRRSLAEVFQVASEPSLDDLYDTFHFDPDNAEIFLNGRRMVLTDNLGLAIMRRELVSALGYERARGVMSRIGYSVGAADAELALELRKDDSLFDIFTVGPQLHALKGSVKVEPLISHRLPLEDFAKGFELASSDPKRMKIQYQISP